MTFYEWLCDDIETLSTYVKDGYVKAVLNQAVKAIRTLSADAQPVRHGRWDVSSMNDFLVCSARCHYWIYKGDQYDYHFCPNCGAKMDGGEK